jgi:hypothetical protein
MHGSLAACWLFESWHEGQQISHEMHDSPDDEHIDLVEQGLNDCDLAGHLAATNNGAEGALGLGHSTIKVVKLL